MPWTSGLEQAALDSRTELVRLAPQRIRLADGVEDAERIAQPTVVVQPARPGHPRF